MKRALTLALLIALVLAGVPGFTIASPAVAAAPIPNPTFADPAFQRVWERYDRPVYNGEAARSFTWGAQVSAGIQEAYAEGEAGRHLVQYFDKSRMEINDPDADRNNPFYVTQGLLARDMIRGEIQEGNNTFRATEPADIPFGDLDDTSEASPTYASFKNLLVAPPLPAGTAITQRLARDGGVSNNADPRGVTSAGVAAGADATNHSIASVFLAFLQTTGPVHENGQTADAPLFVPTFYVTGLPITEAYWATVKAAGQPREVLIQCFERRCLTYSPSNDPAFRVELANTGLQYQRWRYAQAPGQSPAPTPTPSATPSPTPAPTPAPTPPPANPRLGISPASGPAGTKFIASGRDLPAGARIDWSISCSGCQANTGSFPLDPGQTGFDFTISTDTSPAGNYTISFAANGRTVGALDFTVTAPPASSGASQFKAQAATYINQAYPSLWNIVTYCPSANLYLCQAYYNEGQSANTRLIRNLLDLAGATPAACEDLFQRTWRAVGGATEWIGLPFTTRGDAVTSALKAQEWLNYAKHLLANEPGTCR